MEREGVSSTSLSSSEGEDSRSRKRFSKTSISREVRIKVSRSSSELVDGRVPDRRLSSNRSSTVTFLCTQGAFLILSPPIS